MQETSIYLFVNANIPEHTENLMLAHFLNTLGQDLLLQTTQTKSLNETTKISIEQMSLFGCLCRFQNSEVLYLLYFSILKKG